MWSEGILSIEGKEVSYCLKHFEEPSKFGIEKGRISKLELREKQAIICNYDRGWDMKATTNLAKKALKQLLAEFN